MQAFRNCDQVTFAITLILMSEIITALINTSMPFAYLSVETAEVPTERHIYNVRIGEGHNLNKLKIECLKYKILE